MKNKIIVSVVSCVLCLCAGIGTLVGCLVDFNPKTSEKVSAATAPNDTSKTWGDEGTNVDTDWAGSGTETDPYKITSAQELAGLAFLVYDGTAPCKKIDSINYYYGDVYFKQVGDIDLSAYRWRTIGGQGKNSYGCFSGYYNGNSYKVSGVFPQLNSTGSSSAGKQGLFGDVRGESIEKSATIQNVTVKDSYIQGFSELAGIVGYAENAKIDSCINYAGVNGLYSDYAGIVANAENCLITNCTNYGELSNDNLPSRMGGIVGTASNTRIEKCSNEGVVKGGSDIGGIVGRGTNLYVIDCYNIANVTASDSIAGGIVANLTNSNASGFVQYCYNTASITAKGLSGGIVGQLSGSGSEAIVKDCFNVGSVSNTYGTAYGPYGNIVAYNSISSTAIAKCYYVSGTGVGMGGGDVTAKSDLVSVTKTQDFFKNNSNWSAPWNFVGVWEFRSGENGGYPVFKPESWITKADTSWLGDGLTEATAYQIDTSEKLAGIAAKTSAGDSLRGKYFKQTANINLGGYFWTPIGSGQGENMFEGNYDGCGYEITGMYISRTDNDTGLFGVVNKGVLKNINVNDSTIRGRNQVGAVVGLLDNNSEMYNCSSNSYVTGNSTVGGIIGFAFRNIIENCTFTGSVDGVEKVGGIIGSIHGNSVKSCYNYGQVKGTNKVGGLIGEVDNAGANISNCISDGIVIGTTRVGSIIGALYETGRMSNCSGYGQIVFDGDIASDYVGAIVGVVNTATITNSFFIGSCNVEIAPFYSESSTKPSISSCYTLINRMGYYSSGDFSEFSLCIKLNNGLPIQKAVYAVAEFGEPVDAIWFKNKGFSKI